MRPIKCILEIIQNVIVNWSHLNLESGWNWKREHAKVFAEKILRNGSENLAEFIKKYWIYCKKFYLASTRNPLTRHGLVLNFKELFSSFRSKLRTWPQLSLQGRLGWVRGFLTSTVEITWYFQIAHNENKLYNTYSHIVTEIDYSNQQHCVDQLWGIEWIYMLRRFVAFESLFGQVATLWEVTFLTFNISYVNANSPSYFMKNLRKYSWCLQSLK